MKDSGVVASGPSSCGSCGVVLQHMRSLPGPEIKPMSPSLAGRLFATKPPGNPWWFSFVITIRFIYNNLCVYICDYFKLKISAVLMHCNCPAFLFLPPFINVFYVIFYIFLFVYPLTIYCSYKLFYYFCLFTFLLAFKLIIYYFYYLFAFTCENFHVSVWSLSFSLRETPWIHFL